MNYELFLKGKSIPELEIIAENWYSRMNKIRDKNTPKSRMLVLELMTRLTVLAAILCAPITPPPFREGGYIEDPKPHFLEIGHEYIVPKKTKVFYFKK